MGLQVSYGPTSHHGVMRILIAEDEPVMAEAIAEGLRLQALAVDTVHDGDAALERLAVNDYDVLILDRDLPGVHGDDVCRAVVEAGGAVRILMLTASGTVADRVAGLSLGADDYLPKPFALVELVARVRALGRRARPATPPVLQRAGLRLDTARREVFRDGHHVSVSRKEFAVLEELLGADGAVVSTEQLLERAWDEHTDPFTNVVRVTVMTLRRKLGPPQVVETVTGVGYQIP
jgi:DNA-binding response OmpR family regulator